MKRLKILILLLLMTLLFIVQNSQLVKVSFLFWSFEISALLLMSLVLLIGLMIGFGFRYWWQFRHLHDQEKKIWSQ